MAWLSRLDMPESERGTAERAPNALVVKAAQTLLTNSIDRTTRRSDFRMLIESFNCYLCTVVWCFHVSVGVFSRASLESCMPLKFVGVEPFLFERV